MRDIVEKIPSVMIDRPRMPRSTWEALKTHINRERVKKKQALEQTQEFERQKKEREQKKKQEALTLEETKGQIAKLENELTLHKEGKHQLFQELKKVIFQEQDLTKRTIKEAPNPHVYLQPSTRPAGYGSGVHSIYPRALMSAAESIRAQNNAPMATSTSTQPQTSSSVVANNKRPLSPTGPSGSYYRPNSGNENNVSVPGVPAPKYIIYSGAKDKVIPSTMLTTVTTSGTSIVSSPSPSRTEPPPVNSSNYPTTSSMSAQQHNKMLEEDRAKKKLQTYPTTVAHSWSNMTQTSASSRMYMPETTSQTPQQHQQQVGEDERLKFQKQQQQQQQQQHNFFASAGALTRPYAPENQLSMSNSHDKIQQQQAYLSSAVVAAMARSFAHDRNTSESERYKQQQQHAYLSAVAASAPINQERQQQLHREAAAKEDDRFKQQQQQYFQQASGNPSNAMAKATADARLFAQQHQQVVAHMQWRAAAAALVASQHHLAQPGLVATGQSPFRFGSILTGYPRYHGPSTGGSSSQPGPHPNLNHPSQSHQAEKYFQK